MHKYDYLFLKNEKFSISLIGLSNVIAECNFKIAVQKDKYPKTYEKLHKKAVIESTISSSRIEGVETGKKREKELLMENSKPLNHDEQEITGYRDAIVYISDHYNEMEFNEKTIKYIHSLLMNYTGSAKGEYKKTDNEISIRYEDGTYDTIFSTVPHTEVEENMRSMLMAYNAAWHDAEVNNLLMIPCVITDFLAIHPFEDGNGRVSRLLTLMLLYKEGYDVGRYISYEKMIEEYKWNYYQELNKSQKSWHENNNDYSYFIIFNFQILYRCYKEINDRIAEGLNNRISKKERIEQFVFSSVVPVSKADISDYLPDVSTTTIEKVLSDMLKEGKIEKIGSYKNARYRKR